MPEITCRIQRISKVKSISHIHPSTLRGWCKFKSCLNYSAMSLLVNILCIAISSKDEKPVALGLVESIKNFFCTGCGIFLPTDALWRISVFTLTSIQVMACLFGTVLLYKAMLTYLLFEAVHLKCRLLNRSHLSRPCVLICELQCPSKLFVFSTKERITGGSNLVQPPAI